MKFRLILCSFLMLLLLGCGHVKEFGAKLNSHSMAKLKRLPVEAGELKPQVLFEPSAPSEYESTRVSRQFKADVNRLLVWMKLGRGNTFPVQEPPPTKGPLDRGSKLVKLKRFSELEARGPFNLTIKPTTSRQHIRIKGPKATLRHLSAQVVDSRLVLAIDTDDFLPGHADVVIETDELDYLAYEGEGDIKMQGVNSKSVIMDISTTGNVIVDGEKIGLKKLKLSGKGNIVLNGVSSKSLTIESSGEDQVALTGVACLKKLSFSGKSRISIYWIDSPELKIIGSGTGFVRLAGHVGVLETETYNHATIDAKFLRAKRTFVKSFNASTVHLRSTTEQNVLALNNSNIYYYNPSKLNGRFMADTGSVFDNLAFDRY